MDEYVSESRGMAGCVCDGRDTDRCMDERREHYIHEIRNVRHGGEGFIHDEREPMTKAYLSEGREECRRGYFREGRDGGWCFDERRQEYTKALQTGKNIGRICTDESGGVIFEEDGVTSKMRGIDTDMSSGYGDEGLSFDVPGRGEVTGCALPLFDFYVVAFEYVYEYVSE